MLEGVVSRWEGGARVGVEFTDDESNRLVSEFAFEWTEWKVEMVGVARS